MRHFSALADAAEPPYKQGVGVRFPQRPSRTAKPCLHLRKQGFVVAASGLKKCAQGERGLLYYLERLRRTSKPPRSAKSGGKGDEASRPDRAAKEGYGRGAAGELGPVSRRPPPQSRDTPETHSRRSVFVEERCGWEVRFQRHVLGCARIPEGCSLGDGVL